ncbi:FCD domain-containing protein [Nocardioides zeae]
MRRLRGRAPGGAGPAGGVHGRGGAGAGYAELNETHLEFHVALVGLAGSPRLVHTARALVAELKVVLAQIDRAERNAHDQADSHEAIVALLEAGRVDDGLVAIDEHLRDAERDILHALGAT